MPASIPLDALLTWADEEARKWQEFFAVHPEALELKTDIAHTENVRGLLVHIVAVDYAYTGRAGIAPQEGFDEIARRANADPFALGQEARRRFREYLAGAGDAALDAAMTFGTITSGQITASRRKMIAHSLLHGIRHWAQLATFIRQQGLPDPGKHDFLFTTGMK